MTLHVALTHRTTYRYNKPITLGPQTIRLRPAPYARTPIISYALKIEPQPHFLNWQQDPQGNFLARVVFPERVTHFDVTVDLVADMATINPFDFFLEPEAEVTPFTYDPVLEQELAPFRRLETPGPLLAALIESCPKEPGRTIDRLVALNRLIQERTAYIVRMEPGVFTPEETLALGKGSCRDSAWLLVNLLRHLGFAARFVSGYLIQLVADVKPLDGPEGPTSDFTDLHAWAEVYLPGAGWIGLDATSGLLAGEGHIPLAASPEPASAAPISGLAEPAEVEFGFEMKVVRLRETPRVTKPYSQRQWQDILATGYRVDQALTDGEVRLTMGGEPTFVSSSDTEAAEWNTDALGPTKRTLAGRLMRKLMPLWAPGAALVHALGKHYPGEQLPRWAIHAHWRRDGVPVWRDPGLLAGDDDKGHAGYAQAAAFAASLAGRLGVNPQFVRPAFEDVHYYLWKEQRLPVNVVAEDAKLRDPLEREQLARVFAQGLGSPVGSVLPLRRVARDGTRVWNSGKWFFRSDVLFLVPGDSPIGLRLPLDSLPWADPAKAEIEVEADPFAQLGDLPGAAGAAAAAKAAMPPDEAAEPVRTALTVEARGGKIHIFYPPLYAAEDWLELTACVEAVAAEHGTKVVLEGYLPPRDPRLQTFSITPDPGVIEVNIHPAEKWPDMVERTEQLYVTAREVGLAAEKFMLDGRHVGTGGGNHVVMGAARPEDSPFLRRPDLLKSLLGFWLNHPSLSYLFSGLFIGPTSQHPRIDEARQDSLNELEIVFRQIEPHKPVPPWLTDRLFRNILADATGNTHRTEFCIDKMYAPDSATGRLGLVEMRALEMPPDARMSAAQMLLMRSVLAAFWQTPYERRLVRWGTRLHDEFMLPFYVQRDFADALEELAQFGFPLDPAWFEPHFAFRFPKIGDTSVRGIGLELRHALEPWHVLGEESSAGGTARYVDSSAERLQTRVTGWVEERFALSCNGVEVPLSATGTAGEFVGGVRFKAWNPPSALHPALPAQTPLIFDIYDRWTGRSLGGLSHHVAHPGGRNYETFPVNANEAEARRRARFFAFGHTPGASAAPERAPGAEHPRSVDLRRALLK
jgi:uncharacterized protein (DUF2126 family)/transglutaminase-like putative cysteine protease